MISKHFHKLNTVVCSCIWSTIQIGGSYGERYRNYILVGGGDGESTKSIDVNNWNRANKPWITLNSLKICRKPFPNRKRNQNFLILQQPYHGNRISCSRARCSWAVFGSVHCLAFSSCTWLDENHSLCTENTLESLSGNWLSDKLLKIDVICVYWYSVPCSRAGVYQATVVCCSCKDDTEFGARATY